MYIEAEITFEYSTDDAGVTYIQTACTPMLLTSLSIDLLGFVERSSSCAAVRTKWA